ncbi:MAG: alkaline phosphatase D family protein [Saprospiraceae bacterium]|nr:alkaline phosphatase family protein [Lewinellaceae bacterium]
MKHWHIISGVAIALFFSACAYRGHGPHLHGPLLKGNAGLQNGPMIGYVDMMEALIWVQTKSDAYVRVQYWEEAAPNAKYWTAPVRCHPQSLTAKCIANQVQPGRSYAYTVYINGKPVTLPYPATFKTQTLWQWRTDPPEFSLATGSCAYVNEPEYDRPGTPYGSDFHIFNAIYRQKPDLMLWLGDDVYYREPDWNTRTGMIHRWTHDRALPELQPLLASTPQYAIWDDHDFGPNDSDGSWIHKEMAWEVFREFWGNPTFGVNGQKGCTTKFEYADIDFFLLDNRYFRTPNHCATCPDRTLLGKEQMEWFMGALAESRAPFKLVAIGGQVVTTNDHHETCFHYYPAERDTLLQFIERENIKGVVFLTGDRHFTELSAMQNKAGNWVYDLTTSSLTAGSYTNADKEANAHRVEGTLVNRHNFSILHFSGPRTRRELEIRNYDADGQMTWTKTITAEGLK